MSAPYDGQSTNKDVPGVSGENTLPGGVGVRGQGVSAGVVGIGETWHGVTGISRSTIGGAGVYGESDVGPGIIGESKVWHAIYGKSESTVGGAGVSGEHTGGGAGTAGISNTGPGVYGKSTHGAAGLFDGDVVVTGDIKLTGADFAEEFDILEATDVEPGTVMVLDQEGALRSSQEAYDKKVAGVISGAGDYKPGIVLDKQQSQDNRLPVALVGKVYCKVDAQYAPIEVGDLLTTSPTPGYAMKADDPFKAFGSVIGKALHPLKDGQGLVPILIALQ